MAAEGDRSPRTTRGAGGMSPSMASADAAREALLSLTSKEPATVTSALEVLHRVSGGTSADRAAIHAEAGVQRLSFLVSSLNGAGNSLRGSSTIVDMAIETLWNLVQDDDNWAAAAAKDCGSRVIMALLKGHMSSPSIVRNSFLLLASLSWHERNVGLVARLEGGIQLILSVLFDRDADLMVAVPALELLVLYAKSSDNNVHLLAKKDGLAVCANYLRRYATSPRVVAAVLSLLSVCAKHARHAATIGRLGTIKLLVTMLSSRATPGSIALRGVSVLANLCTAPENLSAMWESGAFHVLWLVITRFASSEVGGELLTVASATLWKMLSSQGVGFPCDLDARQTWDLPPYPDNRGQGTEITEPGVDMAGGDAEADTDSEASVAGKEDCDVDADPRSAVASDDDGSDDGDGDGDADGDGDGDGDDDRYGAEAGGRSRSTTEAGDSSPRLTDTDARRTTDRDRDDATGDDGDHDDDRDGGGAHSRLSGKHSAASSQSGGASDGESPATSRTESHAKDATTGSGSGNGNSNSNGATTSRRSRSESKSGGGKKGKGRHRRGHSRSRVPSTSVADKDSDSKRGGSSIASEDAADPDDLFDEDVTDWFPENDDDAARAAAADAERREAAFTHPDNAFLSPDGVATTFVPWLHSREIPSAWGAREVVEYEPMTPLESEARQALVQRMMLSVVARLALPHPSGGEVVYDRFLEEGKSPPLVPDSLRTFLRPPRDADGSGAGAGGGISVRLPTIASDKDTALGTPTRDGSSRRLLLPTHAAGAAMPTSPAAAAAAASAKAHGADLSRFSDEDDIGVGIRRILAEAAADAAMRPTVPPLSFESRFESGNLRAAVRVGAREYELLVQPDTNTGGHTQWFFFRVRGMDPGAKYKFNIVNLEKADSTYNYGMKPLMYCLQSDLDAPVGDTTSVAPGHGWRRVGDDICYYQNHYTKQKAGVALSASANAVAAAAAAAAAASTSGSATPVMSVSGAGADAAGPGAGSGASASGSGAGAASDAEDGSDPPLMPLYTFTFTVTFPRRAHTAFFAYCYPYTASDLQEDEAFWERRCARAGRNLVVPLDERPNDVRVAAKYASAGMYRAIMPEVETDPMLRASSILRKTLLCRTLSGNPVPLYTITNFNSPEAEIAKRPYIILSARVHPGESNASWMMRGVMDFITSTTTEAHELRQRAILKIVPVLNPDGVINGHHRTNLSGVDLNRHWSTPARGRTPTVYYLRHLIKRCNEKKRVLMFCDLHGHSRRKNIFIFGCENTEGVPERLFPKLLDRRAPDFAYGSCNFKVQKGKANCARVAVWRDMNLVNSYTMESSFAGSDQGPNKDMHFCKRQYQEMGHHFVATLLDLVTPDSEVVAEEKLVLQAMHPGKFISAEEKKRRRAAKKKRGKSAVASKKGSASSKSALKSSAARPPKPKSAGSRPKR